MVKISHDAVEALQNILKDKGSSVSIRIDLFEGSCWTGPSFVMVLDEPRKSDMTFTHDNVMFIIKKDILEKLEPIDIGVIKDGDKTLFQIQSKLQSLSYCLAPR